MKKLPITLGLAGAALAFLLLAAPVEAQTRPHPETLIPRVAQTLVPPPAPPVPGQSQGQLPPGFANFNAETLNAGQLRAVANYIDTALESDYLSEADKDALRRLRTAVAAAMNR